MTDSRLRELERDWRTAGTAESEAAYLGERVRSGDLSLEQLEVAALCGHAGACLARNRLLPGAEIGLSYEPTEDEVTHWSFPFGIRPAHYDWGRALAGCGKRAVVQFCVFLAEALASELVSQSRLESLEWLAAGSNWIRCPCEAHRIAAERKLAEVVADWDEVTYGVYSLAQAQAAREPGDAHLLVVSSAASPALFWLEASAALAIAERTVRRAPVLERLSSWALSRE